jgi:hypothetical protein
MLAAVQMGSFYLPFYRLKTLSLIVRNEHRLRVFENRELRRTFGSKRAEITGENCEMKSFISYTPQQKLLG